MAEHSARDLDDHEEVEEREVKFNGRTFHAKMPKPEQILIWKRTLDSLSNEDVSSWNGHQVMAALDRYRKIVDSLISPVDIEWLDDQMLMGRFTIKDGQELMMMILKTYERDPANREERRAIKAPAARRVPSKKGQEKKTP